MGRRDRHRPARPPRLGGAGRGRPDLGDRLQRHHHLDAAADAAAGLGDRARRDADGRALPPARRPGPLERPRLRHRSRRPARHRRPSHRRVRGLGRRPRHGGVPPRRHGGVVHARARPGGRHRPADRRLHRDGHQPHRHAVRRSPGVGGPAAGGHDRLPRGLRRRRVHDLPQPARPPAGRLVRPRPRGGDRQHPGAGRRHADPARGGRRRAGHARHPGGARRRDRPCRAAAAAGQRRPRPAGRRRRPARDHPGPRREPDQRARPADRRRPSTGRRARGSRRSRSRAAPCASSRWPSTTSTTWRRRSSGTRSSGPTAPPVRTPIATASRPSSPGTSPTPPTCRWSSWWTAGRSASSA